MPADRRSDCKVGDGLRADSRRTRRAGRPVADGDTGRTADAGSPTTPLGVAGATAIGARIGRLTRKRRRGRIVVGLACGSTGPAPDRRGHDIQGRDHRGPERPGRGVPDPPHAGHVPVVGGGRPGHQAGDRRRGPHHGAGAGRDEPDVRRGRADAERRAERSGADSQLPGTVAHPGPSQQFPPAMSWTRPAAAPRASSTGAAERPPAATQS